MEDRKGNASHGIDDIKSGDIPKALHTIEDSYAGGHKGFQLWTHITASHERDDWWPSDQAETDALQAASQFLSDLGANNNQLDSGHPIDASKYFPQNPCHN